MAAYILENTHDQLQHQSYGVVSTILRALYCIRILEAKYNPQLIMSSNNKQWRQTSQMHASKLHLVTRALKSMPCLQ